MSQLASVLRYASSNLVSFMFIFGIIFSAFVQTAYLTLNFFLLDFSTIVRSAESMFSLMLGEGYSYSIITKRDQKLAVKFIMAHNAMYM